MLPSGLTSSAALAEPAVRSSEHARVSELSATGGLHWTELDDALPLPFTQWEKNWGVGPLALAIASSDVADALNSEPLRITGLQDGTYVLKVDGEEVGTFNNDRLAAGVNLGLLDTPMTKQAKQVYDLTVSHCDVYNNRWRTV